MAVIETTKPTAAQEQLATFNQNIGGGIIVRQTFSVPAATSWSVVGTILAGGVQVSDIESTLQPAIEALSEVTSVNGDKIYGETDDPILQPDHESVLLVSSQLQVSIGSGGDTFSARANSTESVKPGAGVKWCVWLLRVPTPAIPPNLGASERSALQSAIEGVTGITVARHLVDGTVSASAAANGTLTIQTHVRIEPIPTE